MSLKNRVEKLEKKVREILDIEDYSREMHLQKQVEEAFEETLAELRHRNRKLEERLKQIESKAENSKKGIFVESDIDNLASQLYEESRAEHELSELMLTVLNEDLENVPESEKVKLTLENLKYYGSERETMRNVRVIDSPDQYNPAASPGYIAWCPSHGIAVADHHNYAMLFWLAYINTRKGVMKGKPDLFHLDEHEDLAKPGKIPRSPPETVGQAERYVEQVQINEFIQPFLDWQLFSSTFNYSEGGDSGGIAVGHARQQVEPHIGAEVFDLDLDFFNKVEGSQYIDDWYDMAAKCIEAAEITTIATSPRYIAPEDAARHYREILQRLER